MGRSRKDTIKPELHQRLNASRKRCDVVPLTDSIHYKILKALEKILSQLKKMDKKN